MVVGKMELPDHAWSCQTLIMSATRNKRAQRALGRSPEEKVKGQGEAIIINLYYYNQILVENF